MVKNRYDVVEFLTKFAAALPGETMTYSDSVQVCRLSFTVSVAGAKSDLRFDVEFEMAAEHVTEAVRARVLAVLGEIDYLDSFIAEKYKGFQIVGLTVSKSDVVIVCYGSGDIYFKVTPDASGRWRRLEWS